MLWLTPWVALAITDGTLTADPEGVVGLGAGGIFFCSGTVVAEEWVVTEVVCAETVQRTLDAGQVPQIHIGTIPGTARRVDIVDSMVHPLAGPKVGDPYRVALLTLAQPAGVPAVPLSPRNDVDLVIGEAVTLQGWGLEDDAGVEPSHREGDAAIVDVGAGIVTTEGPSNFCHADAGGPVLDDAGELIGIASYVFPTCVGGSAGSITLQATRSWIQATAGLAVTGTTPVDTGGVVTGASEPTDTGNRGDTGTAAPRSTDTGAPDTDPDTPATPASTTEAPASPAVRDAPTDDKGGCGCTTTPRPVGSLWAVVAWLAVRRGRIR